MAVSKAIVFVRSLGQIKRKCVKAEILLCAAVDTAGHQPALEACAVGRSGSVLKSDGAAAGISALKYMASDVCVDFILRNYVILLCCTVPGPDVLAPASPNEGSRLGLGQIWSSLVQLCL